MSDLSRNARERAYELRHFIAFANDETKRKDADMLDDLADALDAADRERNECRDIAFRLLNMVDPDTASDVRGPEGQHEGEYLLSLVAERLREMGAE